MQLSEYILSQKTALVVFLIQKIPLFFRHTVYSSLQYNKLTIVQVVQNMYFTCIKSFSVCISHSKT